MSLTRVRDLPPHRHPGGDRRDGPCMSVELAVSKVGETVDVLRKPRCCRPIGRASPARFGAEMIEALPNITQNPLDYACLQAGALPRNAASDTAERTTRSASAWTARRQFSAVGINGGRAFTNDIQLDGLPVMGGGYNEAAVMPNTGGPAGSAGDLQQLQRASTATDRP